MNAKAPFVARRTAGRAEGAPHKFPQSGGNPKLQSQQLEKQHCPAGQKPSAVHGWKSAQRPLPSDTHTPSCGPGPHTEPPFDCVKHAPSPQLPHGSIEPHVSLTRTQSPEQ